VNKHTQAEQSEGEPRVDSNSEEPAIESEVGTQQPELSVFERYPYLTKPFAHFKGIKPMVYREPNPIIGPQPFVHFTNTAPVVGTVDDDSAAMNIDPEPPGVTVRNFTPEEMAAMDSVQTAPMKEIVEEFIDPNTRIKTFNHILVPDNEAVLTNSDFGLAFPIAPSKGDSYVRVDTVPSKLYKYNGKKWLEIDKSTTDSYISDDYVRYLITKIRTGEYNVDELTDAESDRIREFLKA